MANLKIAIASCGLRHIRRGIESWADDLALALHRVGADVTLFQGSATGAVETWQRTLPCWRRFEPATARILSVTGKLGGWRYGFGNEYEIEQSSFALPLWKAIRRDYDILHVQDPWIARLLDGLNRKGLSRPRVIIGHGTEEPDSLLRKYRYLQHLAPVYREQFEHVKAQGQLSFAVPNFVDTDRFRPGDRQTARAAWGIPEEALVILSAAALKKHHKRGDYLIREFAGFRKTFGPRALLIMAGAREGETAELIQLGASVLGDSLRVLESVDRAKLPSLYQAADIFALASLHEMMPIVTLEALSCGLPLSCNSTPVLNWITGPAGFPEDLSVPGGLTRQWERLSDSALRASVSLHARAHAVRTFSETVVLAQIEQMYASVMRDK